MVRHTNIRRETEEMRCVPAELSGLEPDREQGGGYEDAGMEAKIPPGTVAIAEGQNLGLMGFVGTTA